MFSHVMLGVNDLEVSKKFYDALLGTLGIAPGVANKNRYFYMTPTGMFAITTPINVSERNWFLNARTSADLSAGQFLTGKITGKPGITFGYPVRDANGTFRAAVFASTDITWFDRLTASFCVPIARSEFDEATAALVGKVEATVGALLRDAGLAAANIDTVFFTGGSSGIPRLRQRIAALLPQARVVEGDLFGSIGAGLAVEAARRYG